MLPCDAKPGRTISSLWGQSHGASITVLCCMSVAVLLYQQTHSALVATAPAEGQSGQALCWETGEEPSRASRATSYREGTVHIPDANEYMLQDGSDRLECAVCAQTWAWPRPLGCSANHSHCKEPNQLLLAIMQSAKWWCLIDNNRNESFSSAHGDV